MEANDEGAIKGELKMGSNGPKVYAVKHPDGSVRAASRSGGAFTSLSDFVLESGGVVYGCILTESLEAVHIRTEDPAGRNRMRGSKYVQSRLGDTYRLAQKDIRTGKMVLFSGTPCQVAGFKAFLGEEPENLFCIDILCHGVPSPKVWKEYIQWQEKMNGAKAIHADFRDNQYGWRAHLETITFHNRKAASSRVFRNLFYQHVALRPSCYECPFKSIRRPGNISIGDYWGIEKALPEWDDDKGVSLVLVNDLAGKQWFERVRDGLVWQETRLEDSMQPALKTTYPVPANREMFWRDFASRPFERIARKYGGYGAWNCMKAKLRDIKRKRG